MKDDFEFSTAGLVSLSRNFFDNEDVDAVARNLIGTILVFESGEAGKIGGTIIETEAYEERDLAAHCYTDDRHPQRKSSEPMRLSGGHVYIFPASYGYCLNFVTGKAGVGSAVLIRALRPLLGKKMMGIRRGPYCRKALTDETFLCHTPVTLCEALGVSDQQNGVALLSSGFELFERQSEPQLMCGPRVRVAEAIKRWRPDLLDSLPGQEAIKCKRRWADKNSENFLIERDRAAFPFTDR